MIALEWTLIVGFVLSLALCTVALIRAFKEGFTRRWIAVLVLGLGFLFIIYLTYNLDKIEPANQVQIMLMVGLLAVTGAYALSAARQADASVKMAKEMSEQRYSENLPLLSPSLRSSMSGLAPDGIPYDFLQNKDIYKVIWRNVGKGVAINSRFSFWTAPTSHGKATFFPFSESGIIVEVGREKEIDYRRMSDGELHEISDGYQPRLQAKYRDVYGREIVTIQEFRIEEENGEKRVLGDLYFTVNGKRLGEESASHD